MPSCLRYTKTSLVSLQSALLLIASSSTIVFTLGCIKFIRDTHAYFTIIAIVFLCAYDMISIHRPFLLRCAKQVVAKQSYLQRLMAQ